MYRFRKDPDYGEEVIVDINERIVIETKHADHVKKMLDQLFNDLEDYRVY